MSRRIVDLIYIEPEKDEKSSIDDIAAKIDYWNDSLQALQKRYADRRTETRSREELEVRSMREFLKKFLYQRVAWIREQVTDSSLRREYWKVLPPFNQKGGIKSLLLHFFQVGESEDRMGLAYRARNREDRELRILWDIYKLRKTIESINTIHRALKRPPCFPSVFSATERERCLDSLRSVFNLLFQMCIRKRHRKELYAELSGRYMKAEAILERSKLNVTYVYPHVVEKFDYRNLFFYVYFQSGMRAKVGQEIEEFRYNYLDFEIVKQEFLIDWLNRKLEGNSRKMAIYGKYAIGGKTLAEIVAEKPNKEIDLLKRLPLNIFNDITAEINQEAGAELKTTVNSFSEEYGEVAEVKRHYDFASKLVQFSIDKLRSLLSSHKEEIRPVKSEQPVEDSASQEKERPKFDIARVKKNQIGYPYFHMETSAYKQKLALLRLKMEDRFASFNGKLSKFLGNVNESFVLSRRTPKFEWSIPYYIKESCGDSVKHHLLILGAEVKAKPLSMGYGDQANRNAHAYTCYFVYACSETEQTLGNIVGKRIARGLEFNEYDSASKEVQKRALQLFDMVLKKEGV